MADVTLPQLGETVTEGTITQWFKKVGDTVAADEPLFEVSTDKVDTEVPSPVAGVVTEIRAAEGDTIEVGTVVAVVGDSAGAPASAPAADPAPAASAAPEAAPAPAPEPEPEVAPAQAEAPAAPAAQPAAESASASLPSPAPATPSSTPAPTAAAPSPSATADDSRLLSPVVRRLVNEHHINPDDLTGTGAGGRITRDDVMDYIDRNGATKASGSSASGAGAAAGVAGAAAVAGTAAAAGAASAPSSQAASGSATAAPAAAASNTAATSSTATASSAPASSASQSSGGAAAGARDTSIKLSKIRQLTGAHMVMSKATSPHAFSVVEVDFANVDVTRNKVKGEFKAAEGFSLTYLPFTARAIVDALAEFPNMNASVDGDQLVVHNYVDLAIAVDLDYEGLLAPVIRNAESKRLRAIAREISDLANRARNRKLSPDEISGGTFTISNNGSAGSVLTMPIINQPQVAIISTDAIVRRPVVVTAADGSETIGIHPVGNIAMSWDHRAFDGAYAAGFLKKVKEILETRDWGTEL